MFGLVTALALAAVPDYSAVVSRNVAVDPQRTGEIVEALVRAFESASGKPGWRLIPVADVAASLAREGLADPASCNAATACVANLARRVHLQRVIALQVFSYGDQVGLDVSVIDSETSTSLATATRFVGLKTLDEDLGALAAELLAHLPVESPSVSDVPAQVSLVPAETSPPIALGESPMRPARKVSIGFAAAGVVALAVAIGLGTAAYVKALANDRTALELALGADVSYAVAGGLGVGALALWFAGAPE